MTDGGNGQTTRTSSNGRTDPTALTTDALMREVEILNKDIDRRFGFYDRLLSDADKQRLEQKEDSNKAISTALASAKEAVENQNTIIERAISKSEAMTASTLDTIKGDIIDLKRFKDQAQGKQVAIIALMGVVFAVIALVLRFL